MKLGIVPDKALAYRSRFSAKQRRGEEAVKAKVWNPKKRMVVTKRSSNTERGRYRNENGNEE